ncbi:uncharacterized protein LOC132548619 [Ylistrum balloti]|uniref:uncharacterized protein LOC132548619 n=1 Tax=Ylistrum balloti TaxID=509963 RepID=UPI0029059DF1|nr:uncharacterized protein LOC132548619 [Ylistrum balloti]
MDVDESASGVLLPLRVKRSLHEEKIVSADDTVKEADMILIPDEQIPIENEISITDDSEHNTEDATVSDIFDEIGHSPFETVKECKPNELYLLEDEDVDLARRVGLIRGSKVDRIPIIPDRKAMRVLLRHIYDVSGEVYDDIPAKYRTSHISLALYLKLCIRSPWSRMKSIGQGQL